MIRVITYAVREWEKPLSGTAPYINHSLQYFNIHILLLLSSQPDGDPDFVTPVSASQPCALNIWVHPSFGTYRTVVTSFRLPYDNTHGVVESHMSRRFLQTAVWLLQIAVQHTAYISNSFFRIPLLAKYVV